ncbi:ScyD/ScyE family protein [Ferruginibacter paludis]|uniref:ScyD/ScyE family protein n=1 Tax=Ferruginibacter paludis TaxID=1310417 RepID=UPI0025B37B8C|nr:ScyD/ScyE family protein [Ferruginibacter paludis]MDN3655195.1 ScyD/ScyE family protein [Ferruginibacter paludis]
MKRFFFGQMAAVIAIALFLTSCKKTTTDVVTANADNAYQLQEKDETALWIDNATATEKKNHEAVRIFATGLNNPRGLKFSPNGRLYVAEGGTGAGTYSSIGQCDQVPFPVGPYLGGTTGGRISKINWKGERTTVTDQLPSSHANEIIGGDVEGVGDVTFIGNTLYAVLAGAGCSHGVPSIPNQVIKVGWNGQWTTVANLSDWLKAHPVQNPEEDDFEPDGTPYSMIDVNNNLYIMEPNHGDFIKVTTAGAISRVADISASQGHIVPTALTWYHGNFYSGNLHPFPVVPGSSSIYRITPAGNVSVFATGFTTVLGVAIDKNGNLYVLENTTVSGMGPTPNTGKIIRVDHSGNREEIATGLNLPTAMTFGPDGKLYVSNVGFGPAAIGGGQILQVSVKKHGDDD